MSCNRENVVWQAEDGTWSMGMYACYPAGDTFDPDWDYEWDVEYDYSKFEWVTRSRHATADAAMNEWDGSNPGGHSELAWSEASRSEVAELEVMRDACLVEMRPPSQAHGYGW